MQKPVSKSFMSIGALLLAGIAAKLENSVKGSRRIPKHTSQVFMGNAKAVDPITHLRRKRPMARYQQTRGY